LPWPFQALVPYCTRTQKLFNLYHGSYSVEGKIKPAGIGLNSVETSTYSGQK